MKKTGRKLSNVRYLISIILLISTIVSLTGCGAGGGSGASQDAIDRIREKGTIVIGGDPIVENICYLDPETQEMTGFIPDMIEGFADVLGVEVEYVSLEWNAMITALQTGQVDMICAHMNRTVERASNITFCDPWLIDNAKVVVAKDSPYQTFEDLQKPGIKFGTSSGSTYETVTKEWFPDSEIVVLPMGTWQDALQTGIIEAQMDDSVLFAGPITRNPDIRVLEENGPSNRYAFAVKHDDWTLADCFNVYLEELKYQGTYAELFEKWMGYSWEPDYTASGF